MPRQKKQKIQKHPPQYQEDLNPHYMAGQNIGAGGPDSPDRAEYASERKDIVSALSSFNQDELAQIPLVRAGARFKEGATYLDIRVAGAKPFTASGDKCAPEGHWIVAKAETPQELWNRLVNRVA
jgi:hypothetical protein